MGSPMRPLVQWLQAACSLLYLSRVPGATDFEHGVIARAALLHMTMVMTMVMCARGYAVGASAWGSGLQR